MPNPVLAVAGIGAGTSLIGAKVQSDAAKSASNAQVQAAQLGIEEQQRQFDVVQELLAPFVSGGSDAFSKMAALAGVQGADAQSEALGLIENSPTLAAAIQYGEDALLQNASATGGLRGGNTEVALAQLRPALLAQEIDRVYGQLGGLAGLGQASAAGVGAAAQSTGNNITSLLGQQGAARAGSALARGEAIGGALGGLNSSLGYLGSFAPTMPEGASIFGAWGF